MPCKCTKLIQTKPPSAPKLETMKSPRDMSDLLDNASRMPQCLHIKTEVRVVHLINKSDYTDDTTITLDTCGRSPIYSAAKYAK